MKASVIGIGGVGGYLDSLLANKYDDVTVVARGARGESIKNNGLILDSAQFGNLITHPKVVDSADKLQDQDIIFICVKNYSLEEVCISLKNAVTPDTILMPVMNGVDPGDRIRAHFPENTVIDSLIYIISYSLDDYSVCQTTKFGNINIGIQNATPKEAAIIQQVYEYMKAAECQVKIAEDIQREIWRKYILNCAYNVATARHNTTIGPLRNDPKKSEEYVALTTEAYQLGAALGVNLKEEYLQQIINRFFHEYTDDASSSFQRDVAAGRPTEVETFSGYITKTADKIGLDLPVSREYYYALLKMQKGRD